MKVLYTKVAGCSTCHCARLMAVKGQPESGYYICTNGLTTRDPYIIYEKLVEGDNFRFNYPDVSCKLPDDEITI